MCYCVKAYYRNSCYGEKRFTERLGLISFGGVLQKLEIEANQRVLTTEKVRLPQICAEFRGFGC